MFEASPYGMTSDSIVNVTEAQARLNKLVGQDSFAISRRGKIVGVFAEHRATVYSVLEQLLASGLIEELKVARGKSQGNG